MEKIYNPANNIKHEETVQKARHNLARSWGRGGVELQNILQKREKVAGANLE